VSGAAPWPGIVAEFHQGKDVDTVLIVDEH